MALKLTSGPAVEPVSLAEARLHLRIDADLTADDSLILMLITAARSHAENVCRRAFITQTYDLYLDAFPRIGRGGALAGYIPGDQLQNGVAGAQARPYSVRFNGSRIDLPFPALQSVAFVKYTDTLGVVQTIDASLYTVDAISEPGAITPVPGTSWPDTQDVTNAVHIQFVAGYGDATAVPAEIKAWILLRMGALYENREEIVVGQRLVSIDLPFVDRMLDRYKIAGYA